MTHDTRSRLDALISEQAAEWFIEFRTGDIDPAGRREFDTWLRTSPEHLRAYIEVAAIWNESGSIRPQREFDTDALIALARVEGNVVSLAARSTPTSAVEASDSTGSLPPVQASSRETPVPRVGIWKRRLSVAAALAVVVAGGAYLSWFQLYRAPEYSTDVGEQRSIRLPDGSTMELNSRSRLRVRFSNTQRMVELVDGQALFHVAKNASRPFIVRSAETNVRAVGTRFDVYKKQSGTVITVLEGRVAVSRAPKEETGDGAHSQRGGGSAVAPTATSPGSATVANSQQATSPTIQDQGVLLSAGEQLAVTDLTTTRTARANVAAATAWTQRQLILQDAPLAQVAEEFNRYSTLKLVVEDRGVPLLRLSGVFTTDPDFLIRYLRERPDIEVTETSSEVRIVRLPLQ